MIYNVYTLQSTPFDPFTTFENTLVTFHVPSHNFFNTRFQLFGTLSGP